MQKAAGDNGYITLKIERFQTKIARTIFVPAHMPLEDDESPTFSKRLTVDAAKVPLRNVLSGRRAKLYCEYDYGDSWNHVTTRQTGPKIGRHAPCPPGSGKKFRHRCGDVSYTAPSSLHE